MYILMHLIPPLSVVLWNSCSAGNAMCWDHAATLASKKCHQLRFPKNFPLSSRCFLCPLVAKISLIV